ncbi:11230_t:CDS:2 [Paraglomus occultum]|uniref:11230_t:CDS:1 n=1 Tax=Paraglomus occultum TaxID=144539 RepID=A0A9N9GX28_9GLOM|nr:11230_t:CDS:2 [Paraglomus occultum]
MAHSMAAFMAFYHANKIEDWTCNNLVEYYRDKTEKKDWKKVLDWIKKDLVRVTRSDSEFDTIRRGKAQEILDKWKDWTTFYNDIIRKDCAHVNMRVRTISTISQLNNLTGDSTQNFDNCLITSGKRDREETERSSPRLKKKAFSSGSSDTRNYFSQIRSEQNEQDQRPRTPEHRIYSSGAMPSWNRESQELCDSDSDPISDHKLLDELSEELKGLGAIELTIRDTLLEILHVSNAKLKKMTRSILNKLNEGQQWFDQVLNKQTWASTSEFIDYCNQFTDHVCNRVQFPTLVRKSFVTGHFDPFVHEGHDIAQDIMKHFSVRLEAPCNISSKSSKLERTYAIDTIIYVMNRIFRMHFDVLDENWIEILTRDTKSHKIDGVLKVFQTKKFTQTIIIMEFSCGQYASEDKDTDDLVKLSRNAKEF